MIISSLCCTDREVVEYNYGFFHMHQKEDVWNMNITDEFNPSWINLLDNIMMEWFRKYTPVLCALGVSLSLLVTKGTPCFVV